MAFSNRFEGHGQASGECGCPAGRYAEPTLWPPSFHDDPQDTDSSCWHELLELIDRAVESGQQEFAPGRDMGPDRWAGVVSLPASISRLTQVTRLVLYGSNVRSLPPEIGQMTSLEVFDPYRSYRLHWFPYEIMRCKRLRESTVSTRVLYGNYKTRAAFPLLPGRLPANSVPRTCSVCDGPLVAGAVAQRWVSLLVGTDVLPLLVHACSAKCIDALPTPPEGYIDHAHSGRAQQPDAKRRADNIYRASGVRRS